MIVKLAVLPYSVWGIPVLVQGLQTGNGAEMQAVGVRRPGQAVSSLWSELAASKTHASRAKVEKLKRQRSYQNAVFPLRGTLTHAGDIARVVYNCYTSDHSLFTLSSS